MSDLDARQSSRSGQPAALSDSGTLGIPATVGTPRTPRTLRTSTRGTFGTPGTLGTPGLGYRPQLDGLRAFAVLAVAWSHWERSYQFGIPFGAGVHLFYVLSGFLITGILLDVRQHADRAAGLKAFYIRRALRIFPAFYLTLAIACLANIPPVRDTIWWHVFYASNVQVVASGEWPGAISHFWSLAVEEQFYLVWPWLIVFAPRRWLVPAIVGAIACGPVLRAYLATLGYRETLLGVLTPGSLDSLAVGALLAVIKPERPDVEPGCGMVPRWRALDRAAGAAGAAWLTLLVVEAAGATLSLPLLAIKQTLQAVAFGWMVWNASVGFGGTGGRLLGSAPVVYIGRISYGVYLAHGFAGAMLAAIGLSSQTLSEPLRFVALSGVTVGVAALSWRFFESPINQLKERFPMRPGPATVDPIGALEPIPARRAGSRTAPD
jgi:peptidoglycan/LPS O-acetylase OafA/YrhL